MLALFFLKILVQLFRLVPFWALYQISNVLAFILYRIVGYRKQVILDNLMQAFPEKSSDEIKRIIKKTYLNLTDLMLESVKSQTTSLPELHRRCRVMNAEIAAEFLQQGQSVILAGSHCGNWEYAGLTLPYGLFGKLVGVYKPLTNKHVELYLNKNRSRGSLVLVSMDDSVAFMRKHLKKEAWAYMMIGDQSPSSRKRAHWVTFFGRETATLPGIDVLARTFGFPVFSYRILRVKRGFYEIEYEPLWLEPETATELDITRAYTKRLEEEIRANPETWLWSHKRWKMKREE
ncbi:MAG: lysophospholipid acyltransferase family protein [Saprospiraceae bacterium]